MPHDTPRVILNMIVKNERLNLPRCFDALFRDGLPPAVDAYLIADTGSTDGTPDYITRYFAEKRIPGDVIHVPFHDFSQARNAALRAARDSDLPGDYLLLCDADMELVYSAPLQPRLVAPAYFVLQRHTAGGMEYPNVRLVRRDVPADYRGVTHEYLDLGGLDRPLLDGVSYIDHATGANRAQKFARDMLLLTGALKENPNDARSVFYLANTFYDLGRNDEAIGLYEQRLTLGGWIEERFISVYRIALCHQRAGRAGEFIGIMQSAGVVAPRAEPWYRLALHYADRGDYHSAHYFASKGCNVAKPAAALFLEPEVYDWRCLDLCALAAYHIGQKKEAADKYRRLLNLVPASDQTRIAANIGWCV